MGTPPAGRCTGRHLCPNGGRPVRQPGLVPNKRAQEKDRQRLFRIIEDLVQWENTTNEEVLQRARDEIWQSWRRACADNADHPRAKELFDRQVLPAFHDPFAGGGSLPLEAQRLGLEAHASDLNPVAVLINKAMIEIPPKFADRPPVNPESRDEKRLMNRTWRGAEGLADDVRSYGQWMRNEAGRRISHHYPKVRVTAAMAAERPDLEWYVGRKLTVIAWLWARTVKSPNPAFADVDVPLASTFILSKKKGKEAWVEPVIENGAYRFEVRSGTPTKEAAKGTKAGRGSNFICVLSGTPISGDYIKSEGKSGGMRAQMMAIVAEGHRGRVYLSPQVEHQFAVKMVQEPRWRPEGLVPARLTGGTCVPYGLDEWWKLFTNRQLVALTTFSDLVSEAREQVRRDAVAAGLPGDGIPLRDGGLGATAYADAISVYLSLAVDRMASTLCTLALWSSSRGQTVTAFARQALPMTWDYPEVNPFGQAAGDYAVSVEGVIKGINGSTECEAYAASANAVDQKISDGRVVSTDPPYYDNIGYADLSDFFYVWLRCSLRTVFPRLFSTLAVPKAEELVASSYRHGSKVKAEAFFLDGMTEAMRALARQSHPGFPITIYYAFKQSETKGKGVVTSTGWETFLGAVIDSGFAVGGTWPIRTERPTGMKVAVNALASSVVLVCRPRPSDAPTATRREFHDRLRSEFKDDLAHLQNSSIAPVDLTQASIGPGMRIFTEYREVLNAAGSAMTVREALVLINVTLDEVLAEQEGEFDPDTRWALTWFEQHGFAEGEYGQAETLSKARNTSVDSLADAGIVESRRGTVRLVKPADLDPEWDPGSDRRLTVWEMTHHLIRALSVSETEAGDLAADLGNRAETARDLAYRLYTISERKRRPADALQYNTLVQSWPEIARFARQHSQSQQRPRPRQTVMLSQAEDGS